MSPVSRIKELPYPEKKFESHDDAWEYCKELRNSLQEEQGERIEDFDWLKIDNRPEIDVREYGARVDGSTDDTTAVQAALSAAGDKDVTVIFPSGTSIVNAVTKLSVSSNTNLVFMPGAILETQGTATSTHSVLYLQGVSNVTISGGTILGVRNNATKPASGEHGMGINIAGSVNVLIQDMYIYDCWGDGIYIDDNSGTTSENINIINNRIYNNRRQGISVTNASKVYIAGNWIYDINGTAPQHGIDIEPNDNETVEYVTMIGNHIINCEGTCINITGASSGSTCGKHTVEGNVLEGSNGGVRIVTASNVVVQGNIIDSNRKSGGTTSRGVYVGADGTTVSQDIIISENVIRDSAGGGIIYAFEDTSIARNHSIVGNVIYDNDARGIRLDHGEGCSIVGNVVYSNLLIGILIEDCTYCNVSNNISRKNQQVGINLLTSSHCVVNGNICVANSQGTDDTDSNISILTNSDYNSIQGNMCRQGAETNKPKYGLLIDPSTCDGNLVINNDLYDSGKTANYVDNGTGTVIDSGNRPLILSGSDTWDAGSIAVGAMEAVDVTVTGAALGDYAYASFSLDLTDLVLDAQVTTTDTVTCVLSNNTADAVDLASGTVYVKVIKR